MIIGNFVSKKISNTKSHIEYLFALIILFSISCKVPKFKHVDPESPYITTNSGKSVQAEIIETQTAKNGREKIIADYQTYSPATISFYSDGKSTFANIKDSLFAKKVVDGKINLYTDNLNRYGKPTSSKPLHYYAQMNGSKEVSQLSYSTLNTMIPPDNAASKYLKKYKSVNTFSSVMGGVGLGFITAGLYQVLQDQRGTPGLPSNPSGVLIVAIGVWDFIAAAIINEENKVNLFKAVEKNNNDNK